MIKTIQEEAIIYGLLDADLGDVVFIILSQPCPPHSERAQVKQHEWASTVRSSTKVSGTFVHRHHGTSLAS